MAALVSTANCVTSVLPALDRFVVRDGTAVRARVADAMDAGSRRAAHASDGVNFRSSRQEGIAMRLSTRNQLAGTVANIETGNVMAVVKVTLDGGQQMTASVTKDAVNDLGLEVGQPVTVLVKSTEVMLAVD
jgi:molybdopterin-binding protein